jgi:Bacterial membrane protein YfhO
VVGFGCEKKASQGRLVTDLRELRSEPSGGSHPVQRPFSKIDVLALGVIGLFCLYLFRDIVLSGHLLIGDDFVTFYLGMKKFLYDEVRLHHEIPYWNPYIFGGMPFWAHFESTIFYPLGFLFYLVSPEKAYGYTMFLHFFLAGLFMYLLTRSVGVSEVGGFIASAVFACNGFLMAILFLGHMSPVESYIWLPLVIYFVNRAVRADGIWRNAIIAGTLWGVQILAGAPQDAFYTFLASALFLLCMAGGGKAVRQTVTRLLSIALLVFVVGAGLSCIQILPALELIHESVRAALDSYEWSTLASFPLQGIITIFMPHFFGNYADGSIWVSNTPWSIPQQNLYTGVLPVVLLGFLSLKGRVEKKIVLFGVLLAGVSLILAFGHHTFIYKLVYLLPGFDRFRAPSKIMVLWGFSMALLAGIGMDGLFSYLRKESIRRLYPILLSVLFLVALVTVFQFVPSAVLRTFSPFVLADAIPEKMPDAARLISSETQRLALVISFILLLILLLRKRVISQSIGAVLLCAVLLMDLGTVHGKAVRHDDTVYAAIGRIKQSVDAGLGQDRSLFRIGSFRYTLGANLEMVLGYQTVGGFTALFPSRYYDYMTRYSENKLPEGWVSLFYGVTKHHVFMDLLNVKYEIAHGEKWIALRDSYLPRAFIVPGSMLLRKGEILDYLASEDFDPRKRILFEKEAFASEPPPLSFGSSSVSGMVEITHYGPDRIVLTAEASRASYLFLSEIFYPGWKALMDGQPVRILRGDYLFRVLELPEGRHSILLEFNPWTIRLGSIVSIVVLLLLGAFALCTVFRRRKTFPVGP